MSEPTSEVDVVVDVVVVGSVGLDTVETPFERRSEVLGGAASYACAAASRFASTGLVGVVGEDFPDAAEGCLQGFGIDLRGLERRAGRTFRWSGVYEDDCVNRRTLRTELGVFESFDPVLPSAYRSPKCLLLGNIGPELQLRVLEQVGDVPFVALDTMDLWIRIAADALREVIGRVTFLTVNDAEARLLTERHNLLDCAERLLAMGPRHVVIKKGEHGALLFGAEGVRIIPAYPVRRLVDPTGAGDVFAGAALGFLAGADAVGWDSLTEALVHGSVTASFGVEAFGLEGLVPLTRAVIAERLGALRTMAA